MSDSDTTEHVAGASSKVERFGAIFGLPFLAAFVIGYFAVAIPHRLRIIFAFAVVAGLVVGQVVNWVAARYRLRGLGLILAIAALSAVVAVATYGYRSSRLFAFAERDQSEESRAAAMLLERFEGDSIDGIPLRPLPRWLRWRVKHLGWVDHPWPTVVATIETLLCVAASVAVVFFPQNGSRNSEDR